MNIDVPPVKLARWLSIALAQRTRNAVSMKNQYGEDSAACAEINSEVADIQAAIGVCVKTAAAAPLRK